MAATISSAIGRVAGRAANRRSGPAESITSDMSWSSSGLEPGAQPRLHHSRRLIDVVGADRGVGLRRCSCSRQQRPFAVIDDGAGQQLLLAFERDVVGALRRGQRRDDDADDRDRDHDAKRHEHAKACPIPSGRLRSSLARQPSREDSHARHGLLRERLSWITTGYVAIIAIGLRMRCESAGNRAAGARRISRHGVNRW